VDQLFPTPLANLDPVELVAATTRPAPTDRPWVLVNMVASIDGAIEVEGRSGGLSGRADKAMFHALRQLPDVIMAGAGTVRVENYGPVQLDADAQARRVTRGQQALPRLAVVSGRAHLDPASRLFSDPTQRPIVITTTTASSDAVDKLRDVADIIIAGSDTVDLRAAFAELREQEVKTLLCEGGPTLDNQLLHDDLVDEWCQTIAPVLTGGTTAQSSISSTPQDARSLQLARVLVEDDVLLLRYARES
jgi:riboflavin-specific deaminase-like protein